MANHHNESCVQVSGFIMKMQVLDDISQASEITQLDVTIDEIFAEACEHHGNDEIEKAAKLYLSVLSRNPKHAGANHNLGYIETHTQSVDTALPRFETAVLSEPQSEQYWVSYIDALVMFGALDTAEQAVEQGKKYGLGVSTAQTLLYEIQQKKAQIKTKTSHKDSNDHAITTIIPAYKFNYIKDLLLGLSSQTYQNFKVIISDDSPDNVVIKHLDALQKEGVSGISNNINLTVVEGPKKGSFANVVHLLNLWNGSTPLLHILFDDDLIYPTFYEKHVAAHANKALSSSISYRWVCNESGFPIQSPSVPAFLSESDTTVSNIDTDLLFQTTIPYCANWLGEFSNSVFSKEVALEFKHQSMDGIPYHGLGDIGLFLQGALQGETAIIKEHLGSFRSNPHQNSINKASVSLWCGLIAWIALAFSAYKLNKISSSQVKQCINKVNDSIFRHFNEIPDLVEIARLSEQYPVGESEYEKAFMVLWHQLLNKDSAWTTAMEIKKKPGVLEAA